ncbi:S-layer homology domain-containing protein [Aneurinibacillus sp. REN35]|uniref:S-layer homology domain-containing protein n=1 Tax=Aneurinibacillus sp. REN35 TaxID=3237286 RepID=UPI003527FCEE
MQKKIGLLLILLALIFPTRMFAYVYPTDVEGSYAKEQILELMGVGIITGYKDHTFKPLNPITRAEFASLLAGALELPDNPKAAAMFRDVPTWAQGAVGALVHEGLTKGIGPNEFGAKNQITRQEMTTLLVRGMGMEDYAEAMDLPLSFADSNKIASWAKPHVAFSQAIGFVKGDGTNFNPLGSAQRQAAAMLIHGMTLNAEMFSERALTLILNENGITDIKKLIIMNDGIIKILHESGEVSFFDFDTGEIYGINLFEATGADWLSMSDEDKASFINELITHWDATEEIKIKQGGVDISKVKPAVDEHFKDPANSREKISSAAGKIMKDMGFITFTESEIPLP